MTSRFGVLTAVLRSPLLRRLELAYLFFAFGEWATWVAIVVYAYGRGGAGEAGIVVFVELAPSIVLAPAVAALGDRFPRDRVLLATYVAQAFVMTATAAALAGGGPPVLIYGLATITATLVALSRPIHSALAPEVVTSPDDLTAANVVSGMAESAGSLVGPLGAGVLIGLGGPAAVFVVAAIGNVAGAAAVFDVARRRAGARQAEPPVANLPAAEGSDPGSDGASRWRASGRELIGGLAAILADHRLRGVVLIATWATFLVGAMDILYAVLAIDLMGLDGGGVGFVGALGGVGAILGSAAGLMLIGRERLGVALAGSVVLFGVGIATISLATESVAAVGLLVLAGAGAGLTNVGALTLIHRLAGDDVMSRVFGVLQGMMMGATALGALAVPVTISLVGNRAAFAVAGLSLPVVLLLVGRAIVRGDQLDTGRGAELRLLRGVPMLAPLSGPVLERLAVAITRSRFEPGAIVINEGDRGDQFYVVESGELVVSVDGREVRRLGPGDGFGEIALVRDVPRTATVTAIDDVALVELGRSPFVEALGGQPRSRTIAAGLVDAHLAADGARS
ncbi:MAG: MFS transporter [Candidatus Limnocylindrales bacterium]